MTDSSFAPSSPATSRSISAAASTVSPGLEGPGASVGTRGLQPSPLSLPLSKRFPFQFVAVLYGVKIAGCTVHFVDGGTDTGPVIAQAAVPVLDDDGEESLRQRILAEEHRLLPEVVRAMAEGRVQRRGRHVRVAVPTTPPV